MSSNEEYRKKLAWENHKLKLWFVWINILLVGFVLTITLGVSYALKGVIDTICPKGITYCIGKDLSGTYNNFMEVIKHGSSKDRAVKGVGNEVDHQQNGKEIKRSVGYDKQRRVRVSKDGDQIKAAGE